LNSANFSPPRSSSSVGSVQCIRASKRSIESPLPERHIRARSEARTALDRKGRDESRVRRGVEAPTLHFAAPSMVVCCHLFKNRGKLLAVRAPRSIDFHEPDSSPNFVVVALHVEFMRLLECECQRARHDEQKQAQH
jgi:hypothetical protein